MFGLGRTAGLAIAASILGAGVLGSVALGAFSPSAVDTFSVVPGLTGTAPANGPAGDRLKGVLDGLVAKGVITQAQEDAILGALASTRDDKGLLRRFFAGLIDESAGYLGIDTKALREQLPGTSLAAIADATPGKSADGLVAALVAGVNDAVAKALADGKLTQEQADRITAGAPDHVAKLVDHTWQQRTPRAPKVRLPSVLSFIGDAGAAARDYLGLSQQDLVAQLRSGKSLAEIANATAGKSRDGLVAAITAAADARIDPAVTEGKLTAEQATALKTKVATYVAKIVDRSGVRGLGGPSGATTNPRKG